MRSYAQLFALEEQQIAAQPGAVEIVDSTAPSGERVTDPEGVIETDVGEALLDEADRELQAGFEETDQVETAMGSLEGYRAQLEQMIESGNCALESVQFIEDAARREWARLGVKTRAFSMESASDPVAYGHLVLENLLTRMFFDPMVNNVKLFKDFVMDIFRSTQGMHRKYSEKVITAVHEYHGRERDWDDGVSKVPFGQLFLYFAVAHRNIEDWNGKEFVQDMAFNVEATEYMLHTYPKAIIDELKKITTALGASDFEGVLSGLERCRSPMELFDQKYFSKIGTQATGLLTKYFNAANVEEHLGGSRRPLSYNGHTYEKIAELASPVYVKESMRMKDVADGIYEVLKRTPGGSVVDGVMSVVTAIRPVTFTKPDADKVASMMEKNVRAIDGFYHLQGELNGALTGLEHAFSKLEGKVADEGGTRGLMRQIGQISRNYMKAFESPALIELKRAIRGSKYYAYLLRRIIYNAS